MIFINPIGGLASQFHKYAVALALAKRHNTKIKFYIELDRNNKDRPFELDKFDIDIEYANKFEVFYIKILKKLNRLKRKLGIQDKTHTFKGLKTYEYFKSVNNGSYLSSEWVLGDIYFRDIHDTLKDKFQLKRPMSEEAAKFSNSISNSNSVSIHFRRGDYLAPNCSKFHGNLMVDYYQSAVKVMEQKINNPVLFIFSDDIEWVKKNFTVPHQCYYLNISSHEDIILMSQCKHNIIANSGYSFLASYFNNNESKTIIAPKQWVADDEINEKINAYTDMTKWIRI